MLPSGLQNLVNLQHLDIKGTILKEMPRGMSKLKNLKHLSYFVVGKHKENGVKELGELSNLHGSLWISKLKNVTNSAEALKARMKGKINIDDLFLEWSSGGDMVTATHTDREIIDKLQPHESLKRLRIKRYRCAKFPDWVGHSSYLNMTHVSLKSCSNCCMLPSLGQLPSLKFLDIENFNGLESIGSEFYRTDDDHSSWVKPRFPSLEYLSFYRIPDWEVWHSSESHAFPQLKHLIINNCCSLRGDLPSHLPALKTLQITSCPRLTDLPNHLPTLETLEVYNCEQLVSSLPRAPRIRELRIFESDKVKLQDFPISLQSLSIEGCKPVEGFGIITINQITCLQYLRISDCLFAITFHGDCYCQKLEFPKLQQQIHKFLESLEIDNSCNSLTSFPLEAFPNLKHLRSEKCENLESLSMLPSQVSSLKILDIHSCPNFIWFPREGLAAPIMTIFHLSQCYKLKSLPLQMHILLPKLDSLSIWECPEIDSFPEGGLPPNLTSLQIRSCKKLLRSLSSMGVHEGLTDLRISGASSETESESVQSFPKQGLLPQLPSLKTLQLDGFETLETLDCKGLLHLTSLQVLEIEDCPKLQNLVGERLPSSLTALQIDRCALLGKRCQEKNVEIWPKISHIPGIRVDWDWIA